MNNILLQNERDSDLIVASSGATTRNRDFFSGKPIRLEPSGIRTDNFRKNNVLLFNHDAEDVPIGLAEVFMREGKLVARPSFHERNERSRLIARLWEDKVIKASSVRINLTDADIAAIEETDEMLNIPTSELVELSLVTLPADADAVRQHLMSLQLSLDSFMEEIQMNEEKEIQDEDVVSEETTVSEHIDNPVVFDMDDQSVQELASALGIDILVERVQQQEETIFALKQRIGELEGEPVVTKNVARFSFNRPASAKQDDVPQNIATPGQTNGRSQKYSVASRQIARMNRNGGK